MNIGEGVYDGQAHWEWRVELMKPDEARADVIDRQQEVKQQRRDEQLEAAKEQLSKVLVRYPNGETKTILRDQSGFAQQSIQCCPGRS